MSMLSFDRGRENIRCVGWRLANCRTLFASGLDIRGPHFRKGMWGVSRKYIFGCPEIRSLGAPARENPNPTGLTRGSLISSGAESW